MALVPGLQVTLYQVGDTIQSASFNNFLDALDSSYCGHDDPTQDAIYPNSVACSNVPLTNVISTSCEFLSPMLTLNGLAEPDSTIDGYNEADLTPAYEQRQCNEYLKLGLLGTTVLYSCVPSSSLFDPRLTPSSIGREITVSLATVASVSLLLVSRFDPARLTRVVVDTDLAGRDRQLLIDWYQVQPIFPVRPRSFVSSLRYNSSLRL